MDMMWPIHLIDDVTLDSKVKDLQIPFQDEEIKPGRCAHISASSIPESLQNTKFKDIFYISGDVHALTSRDYLASANQEHTLARLFGEEGDFYPCNPNNIKKYQN